MTAPMRVPPNALEAERAVLAGILLEREAIHVVAEILRDREDFYGEANGRVYDAMRVLHGRGQPIDHTTLREELMRSGMLARIGGDEYLFAITSSLPSVENIEAHASIVREKARVRALLMACHDIAAKGYGDYGDAATYFDRAEATVFALSGAESRRGGPRLVDPVEMMRHIQDVVDGKVEPDGLSTGIACLDRATDGTQPGESIVIGGGTGQGKSSLAMGVAFHAAEKTGKPALYVSQEMPRKLCQLRLLAMVSGVNAKSIRRGRLTPDDWRKIATASKRIADTKFLITDDVGMTIDQVRSQARRVAAQYGGMAAVVVDYLQILGESGDKGRSREREVAAASVGCKRLAVELDTRVFTLSQLNRGVDDRPDKWPQVSDLRESGAIEQDADQIWLPHRPGYYAAQMSKEQAPPQRGRVRSTIQPGEDDGRAFIILGKQRGGGPGVVNLMFDGPSTRFYDPHDDGRDDVTIRGVPHYTEGRPDDSDGDGEPWSE